ncbi:MAG: hypothetical protein Q7U82_00860 [Gammaproteobacteria bacterium]|nr:hypothetical protein [Gammaproteobacteria bacterium]MDO8742012.1 hypothetical protein [bacterium]
MSKRILADGSIYVAPRMLGYYDHGSPRILDEDTSEILDPNDFQTKLRIYEREVKEWFLKPAKNILELSSFNNSFVVIMICMSYIEGVEQYICGKSSRNNSRVFFFNSIKRLFQNQFSDVEMQSLYSKTRCGLFHNGMVKGGVLFNNTDLSAALEIYESGEDIRINPRLLLGVIENDFEEYLVKLKSTIENSNKINNIYRINFEKVFDVLGEAKEAGISYD